MLECINRNRLGLDTFMAIDWETTFREWAAAPSDTEQTRCNNAIGIVRRAISRSSDLSARRVDVFAQGSYRNHTNVPADSDVDVCALCHDVFFYELPKDANPAYFGLTNPATYSYPEYKNSVGSALLSYLGSSAVRRGDLPPKVVPATELVFRAS
jgi:hypothetical protein